MEGMPGGTDVPTLRMGSTYRRAGSQRPLSSRKPSRASGIAVDPLGPRSPSHCDSMPGWVRCWGWGGGSKGSQASAPAPYSSQSHFAEGQDPVSIRELGCLAEHQAWGWAGPSCVCLGPVD